MYNMRYILQKENELHVDIIMNMSEEKLDEVMLNGTKGAA